MVRKATAYVADFIKGIHKNLEPGEFDVRTGFWISRADEGSLFLDQAERADYTSTVDRLLKDFAQRGDLSRRSVERYLQDALFHSLDLGGKQEKPFAERAEEALDELRKRLSSPPLSYRCFVPVHGFAPKDLPFTFGGIRFVRFGPSQQRQLLKTLGTGTEDQGFRLLVGRLKEREPWGKPCAIVQVEARDFETALVRARLATRIAVESINFFCDLIPYNHGWLYLPSEGARVVDITPVISSEGQVWLHHTVVGPRAPFSVESLRKNARVLRHLQALGTLYRVGRPKTAGEVLLAAFRWAGRASVEQRREQSFLLYAIALEAALLPEQNRQELTYRLGLRVARLLGRSQRQRAEMKKSVSNLYKVRSSIVHSGSYEVTDEQLGHLRSLTKVALLRLLRLRSLWGCSPEKLGEWLEALSDR